MLKSRCLSRLTWITGETPLCVLIEIDFDGTAMANPTNFIPYNVKLERGIPTDRQTDNEVMLRGCAGCRGHKCTQNNEHTMASTRAHVGTESRRHCQRALKRRRRCRGETSWEKWAGDGQDDSSVLERLTCQLVVACGRGDANMRCRKLSHDYRSYGKGRSPGQHAWGKKKPDWS